MEDMKKLSLTRSGGTTYEARLGEYIAYMDIRPADGWCSIDSAPTQADMDAIAAAVDAMSDEDIFALAGE